VEVLQYFEAVLNKYQGTSLLNSGPKPMGQYIIQANLSPAQVWKSIVHQSQEKSLY